MESNLQPELNTQIRTRRRRDMGVWPIRKGADCDRAVAEINNLAVRPKGSFPIDRRRCFYNGNPG
jgi:hypothetical protein